MTEAEKVSEDMLMALADGELDAETEARLRAQVAADPALRRRYDDFVRSAEAVRGLFAGTLAEPPPERLVAALRAAPPPARAPRAWPWASGVGLPPLAAAVMLAAGLGYLVGLGAGGGDGSGDGLGGLRAAAEALDGSPTGEVVELADGSRAAVLASFDTVAGPCRQFQVRDGGGRVQESLGCRTAEGWRIALVLPQTASGEYAPAAGATAGALDAYLGAIEASPPLEAEAEAARIRAGWATPD